MQPLRSGAGGDLRARPGQRGAARLAARAARPLPCPVPARSGGLCQRPGGERRRGGCPGDGRGRRRHGRRPRIAPGLVAGPRTRELGPRTRTGPPRAALAAASPLAQARGHGGSGGERAQTPRAAQGGLAAAAARVESFFLEPVETGDPPPSDPPPTDPTMESAAPHESIPAAPPQDAALRPVVAVFGLAHRCGATVVARGLAAELAGRDRAGVAAGASPAAGGGAPRARPPPGGAPGRAPGV